jgi:hypothetical protein
VRQVASVGQVKAHDAVVGVEQRCVHCKVGWGSRQSLQADTRAQMRQNRGNLSMRDAACARLGHGVCIVATRQ